MDAWLVVVAYLVGGIPFAFLLARRVSGPDVRHVGSGNLGTTNVLRTCGKSTALAVLVLDVSKGSAAVLLARSMGADAAIQAVVAGGVVTGHVFPVWLKFRGGRGVATACGAFAVLAPVATLLAVATFALVVGTTRYVSLGSVTASLVLAPLVYLRATDSSLALAAAVVAVLVVWRHTSNLTRLLNGSERRLGQDV